MKRNKGELAADEVIQFIEMLHLTGDFYGHPFILLDWQKEILRDIYGTIKPDGLRQYKQAYLEIPKKNGKTTMVGGLGLYHLVCDPPGGEIYCCAAEKEQAAISYRAAKDMIAQDKALEKMLKVVDSKKEIYNKRTGTFMKVLSAEAYSKHGINPSVVIFDELHAQPNRDLWDVMQFGASSARREPLLLTITTAGDDPDRKSIGWEQHELAQKIISGEVVDPTKYAKIYGAPDDADIYDESVWRECNPSLGVSIPIDTLRSEAAAAKESAAVEKLFRWLRLNQWVQLKRLSWLPITLWDETEIDISRERLRGKRCYTGIDLSRTIDLTSIACLFPPQDEVDKWTFFIDSFCPAERIKERSTRDKVDYMRWADNGYLTATPGDVVDYATVRAHIEQLERDYKVAYHCGDPWHLEIVKQLLPIEIQRKFIEIPQSISGMAPSMHEMERLFTGKEIRHERNPLNRWAFGNVIVATDGNENQKPMKNKSIERIDPIVALINAMAGAIKLEPKRTVYESRGMRSLL